MEDRQLKRMLQGQSALAKKVFAAVPVDEPWKFDKIHRVLHEMGKTSAHITAVHACLGQLKDAGIIREPERYYYQRPALPVGIKVAAKRNPDAVKEKAPTAPPTPFKGQDIFPPEPIAPQPPVEQPVKVTVVSPTLEIHQTPLQESISMGKIVSKPAAPKTPLELVMEITTDVTALQAEMNDRFGKLIARIEGVALLVQAETEQNGEAAKKFKQMQELLK